MISNGTPKWWSFGPSEIQVLGTAMTEVIYNNVSYYKNNQMGFLSPSTSEYKYFTNGSTTINTKNVGPSTTIFATPSYDYKQVVRSRGSSGTVVSRSSYNDNTPTITEITGNPVTIGSCFCSPLDSNYYINVDRGSSTTYLDVCKWGNNSIVSELRISTSEVPLNFDLFNVAKGVVLVGIQGNPSCKIFRCDSAGKNPTWTDASISLPNYGTCYDVDLDRTFWTSATKYYSTTGTYLSCNINTNYASAKTAAVWDGVYGYTPTAATSGGLIIGAGKPTSTFSNVFTISTNASSLGQLDHSYCILKHAGSILFCTSVLTTTSLGTKVLDFTILDGTSTSPAFPPLVERRGTYIGTASTSSVDSFITPFLNW